MKLYRRGRKRRIIPEFNCVGEQLDKSCERVQSQHLGVDP